ncbi:hypothetical protein QR680_012027 [Steinernema hermaphroditum]|uniref:Uncharacterized protein n=1 Tax=Steinernema hermaphroditum TaxID=289476 RepID=A0AA39I0N2_9BILA|nr:hypothetical protein QR680_012027 [Steinernema hermaphroditum]
MTSVAAWLRTIRSDMVPPRLHHQAHGTDTMGRTAPNILDAGRLGAHTWVTGKCLRTTFSRNYIVKGDFKFGTRYLANLGEQNRLLLHKTESVSCTRWMKKYKEHLRATDKKN